MIQPSGLSIGERRFHIRNRRIVSVTPKEAPVRAALCVPGSQHGSRELQ